MSMQEKKSAKGTPYAIIKFSDKTGEFELFLFAEMLVKNRDKLKESESFVITLHRDNLTKDPTKIRMNVKKILHLDEFISKPYSNVTIELKENFKIEELKNMLSQNGDTKINIIIKNKNQKVNYLLQNNRKFDLKLLKALKTKEYVAKIRV